MIYIVYKTTNLINNKTYIGIHQTNNLDDGYLGSGLAMKRAIKKYGKDKFKREILEYCSSFDELLIKEKEYVNDEWINEETNYNLKTGGQSTGLLSEESKNKISNTLKRKYETGEIDRRIGVKTGPMSDEQKEKMSKTLIEGYESGRIKKNIGREPWNKGKKNTQIAWNKGLKTGPMSDEQKEKMSKTLIERYKTTKHPRKGGSSWNKGKKDLPPSWNKGVKMEQTKCPHCDKMVDVGNGKRWHFDNCKFKQL